MKLGLKKREKHNPSEKDLQAIFHKELEPYIKRQELQDYLSKIQSNEEKRKKWESLTTTKKLQLLRYVLSKRGDVKDGKK